MSGFSDFIVYADESGSASLEGAADPTFPLFVLAVTLVRKSTYVEDIVPSLQKLKFASVGHDQIILHERDIRRQKGAFAFLQADQQIRQQFLTAIDTIVASAEMDVCAAVIHKDELRAKYTQPFDPYELALGLVMERLLSRLIELGETGKTVHVVFECRGKKEDAELELAFRRISANQFNWGYRRPDFTQVRWEPLFVDKKSNSTGLQLADLMARPIGLKRLRPTQPNHAYDVLQPKIIGLKWFP